MVNAYAYEYELDDEQRESLYHVIDRLDIWFLDKEIKKIKSKNKGGKK